jgi:hypothetical protein
VLDPEVGAAWEALVGDLEKAQEAYARLRTRWAEILRVPGGAPEISASAEKIVSYLMPTPSSPTPRRRG